MSKGFETKKDDLVKTVQKGIESPFGLVKLSSIVNGFSYNHSDTKRYSITILFHIKDSANFFQDLEKIRLATEAEPFIQPIMIQEGDGEPEESGYYTIKFNSKFKPKILELSDNETFPYDTKEELKPNTKIKIKFDINTYLDKFTKKTKFTLPATEIIIVRENGRRNRKQT